MHYTIASFDDVCTCSNYISLSITFVYYIIDSFDDVCTCSNYVSLSLTFVYYIIDSFDDVYTCSEHVFHRQLYKSYVIITQREEDICLINNNIKDCAEKALSQYFRRDSGNQL